MFTCMLLGHRKISQYIYGLTVKYTRNYHQFAIQRCIRTHGEGIRLKSPSCVRTQNYASSVDSMTLQNEKILSYVSDCVADHDNISQKLSTDIGDMTDKDRQKLMKRLIELGPLVDVVKRYQKIEQETDETEKMLESCGDDKEMKSLIQIELVEYIDQKQTLELEILDRLVPVERDNDYDLILEIQAGVGGQEAMLFASDLEDMYAAYSRYRGWSYDVINMDSTELGGLRAVSVSVSGEGAYGSMKYEGGVHRVQRVPQTEKTGRMHTSTATVAVMPQPDEIDVEISQKDLRVDTFKSSGKGGQSVNTTDSAVRITHIPSGEVVECQRERSQIKNRQLALKILRSRLYERKIEEQRKNTASSRKLQVGGRSRSEKIRTYNYNQDRITDHRIGVTVHGISVFMNGREKLDEMIQTLLEEGRIERIQEILERR